MQIFSKDKHLKALLILLIGLFCFSLFKNISYPLLWNDEAECVMHSQRVLEYGYPKVHDGKNVVYMIHHKNKRLALDVDTDAYVGISWSMFYYCTIGLLLSNLTDDLYLKTALLRIPFAILGMFALYIFLLSIFPAFKKNKTKILFTILFFLCSLFSVGLVLHLREVRYYSIILFLGACLLYTYFNYRYYLKINFAKYAVATTVLLWLLFNTLPPPFFIFFGIIGLNECLIFIQRLLEKTHDNKESFINFFKSISPLLLAFLLVIPVMNFFKSLRLSEETSKQYDYGIELYLEHVQTVVSYFHKFEFLYLALFVKLILIVFYIMRKRPKKGGNLAMQLKISNFLSFFFITFVLIIALIPHYIFMRYYVLLLPMFLLIISLDILIVYKMLDKLKSNNKKQLVYGSYILALVLITFAQLQANAKTIKGHVYELFHQYKGPLDYTIPFINENFNNTEDLVIATNYEECSYMYYLNSKVTMGFVSNNYEEDIKIQPDIIVYRKGWRHNPLPYNKFLEKEPHAIVSFPIFDSRVNNMPELNNKNNHHIFKKITASKASENVEMHLKVPPYQGKGELGLKINFMEIAIPFNKAGVFKFRGNMYFEKGIYDRAIADYEKALSMGGEDSEIYLNRGIIYFTTNRYELAMEDFNKTLELDPGNKDALLNRSSIYVVTKKYQKAINEFNKLINIDPENANAFYNRGMSHHYLGRIKKAITDYDKAVELNSDYKEAYFNRSIAYESIGEFKKALEDVLKARDLGYQVDENFMKKLKRLVN